MTATLQEENIAPAIRSQLDFLRELNDIKRLYAQNIGNESFATWAFRRACAGLTDGQPLQADIWCAAIVSAARLGAITPEILRDAGLSEIERLRIFQQSIETHVSLSNDVRSALTKACCAFDGISSGNTSSPQDWVERLAAAPRAGATCPGKPRIALEPPEMHSDHCMMVAVYGYLLADLFGAKREDAWLIGLCHHFHNAYLPDAGFTGEIMLGPHLHQVIEAFRLRGIHALSPELQGRVICLFEEIIGVSTPLAKTFHAADTLDRVIQMEHYERVAKFRVMHALTDLNLVHEGPAQKFQHDLLNSVGLMNEGKT